MATVQIDESWFTQGDCRCPNCRLAKLYACMTVWGVDEAEAARRLGLPAQEYMLDAGSGKVEVGADGTVS